MKFAAGLVLAALAVTAANAGNPAYLRSSDDASASEDFDFSASDSLDASGSDGCPDECPDKYKPVMDDAGVEYPNKCFLRMAQCKGTSSGSLDLSDFYGSGSIDLDDLTIDLTDLFGSDSTDVSDVTVNIMSLIGSGSDQVDLQDIIDAFEEEQASDDSESGSDDDLSWLLDSDSESGSEDPTLVKGKGGVATKGKTPIYEDDSESGTDDLSWLDDSDSEFGSEDPTLVKGATKSKTPIVQDDSESGSDDLSWLLDSDSESGSEDPILVKGVNKGGAATKGKTPIYEDDSESGSDDDVLVKGGKEPATKSSKSSKTEKATKTGTTTGSIGELFDDASEGGIIGDESDEEDPTLVKGATKGKTPIVQDDSESGSDDDVLVKGVKEPATKSSKSSKTEKATKTGTTTDLIDQLFDDASEDGIIGDESDEEDPTLVKGATKGGAATKGKTPLYEEDDSESESASDEDDHLQHEQLQTSVAEKAATKSSKTLLP